MADYPVSRHRSGFQFAAGSILLVSLAQLLLKYSTLTINQFTFDVVYNIHFLMALFTAGLIYLLSILLWIKTLSYLPLNIAYPLLSLSYPIVYFVASTSSYFDEAINPQRNIGVILIVCGVLIGARNR